MTQTAIPDDFHDDYEYLYDLQFDEVKGPLLRSISTETLEAVAVGEQFEDDHCPCYNVDVTISGVVIKIAFHWLSDEGAVIIGSLHMDNAHTLKQFIEWIILDCTPE